MFDAIFGGIMDVNEVTPLTTAELAAFLDRLGVLIPAVDDVDRIEQITALRKLKAALCAAQIDPIIALVASTRQSTGSGVTSDGTTITRTDARASAAAQVAFALTVSPHFGEESVATAMALATEMPYARALLAVGALTEKRAGILVSQTSDLTAEQRGQVDKQLCSDPDTLRGCGDRIVAARAKALAQKLNPVAAVKRAKKAPTQRRVSTRPAPDLMVYLTTLLPMKVAICVFATLRRDADAIVATGDPEGRTRDQIMADLLVTRVLGTASASKVPVEVVLVMSDATLLASGSESAIVPGFGPVPADIARRWAADADAQVSLRKLYSATTSGALTAMESRSRIFPTGLKRLISIRDQVCRTPFCDAPIRHADHVVPHVDGGATSEANAAGLCAACNQVKNAPGWTTIPTTEAGGRHRYDVITPTGHRHSSSAPPLPTPCDADELRRSA